MTRRPRQRGRDRGAPDERRAERREQLLDAAVVAIRAEGPDVSMERMAAEAGVTKPIIYRHFGDREGLIRALADRFADALRVDITRSLATPDAEPQELLRATIDAYLAFVERDPDVYQFIIRAAVSPLGQEEDALGTFIRQIAANVAAVLGERLREVGADSGPAEPWAYGMIGMVHQAGDWWLERRTMPRERLVQYLVDLLWSGLGAFSPEDQAAGR